VEKNDAEDFKNAGGKRWNVDIKELREISHLEKTQDQECTVKIVARLYLN
jgi:hypothetical protein